MKDTLPKCCEMAKEDVKTGERKIFACRLEFEKEAALLFVAMAEAHLRYCKAARNE